MRSIAFLVFPQFQILDATGPLAAFEIAGRHMTPAPYRLQLVSENGGSVVSSSGLEVHTQALGDAPFDTLLVAGGEGVEDAAQSPVLRAFVQAAAGSARRVVSVCSGALVLAAAGLLDGRRATTHWRRAAQLQQRYPAVRVECDRIYVQDGPVWTSAGITAGLDLALALIEDDLGSEIARSTARHLVVYHRRAGGQSQFSTLLAIDPPSDRIRTALAFARERLHEPLPVERLAAAACLSPRQFGRAFRMETGQTPAKAVEQLRVEAARLRIEASREPIEAIAQAVGFTDPERMRRAFLRLYGQPPQALRRVARS